MSQSHGVLLTGTTGALGPALAAELLVSEPKRNLSILIRAGNSSVTERFNEWTDAVTQVFIEQQNRMLQPKNWRARVTPVCGDVGTDNLGLDRETYDQLLKNTSIVVHAAADTQFLGSSEDQRNINVEGTRRMLEFARNCKSLDRMIQVSTVCTSGTRLGLIEEKPLLNPPGFVNNYERTKWEAEQLALATDLPLGIARVSIVIGAHASGYVHRLGAFHNLLKWFARGFVPVIPGTETTEVDLVSTEIVTQFLAKAVSAKWDSHSIWQVAAGDQAALLPEICSTVWGEVRPGQAVVSLEPGGGPFILDQATFDQVRASKTRPRDRIVRQALDSINSFLPMLLYPRKYQTSNAERLWGGTLPWPDWRQTLIRVMKSCGFCPSDIRAPKPALSAA